MVIYRGRLHRVTRAAYNGHIDTILYMWKPVQRPPINAVYVGYFQYDGETVRVYTKNWPRWPLLLIPLLCGILAYAWTHPTVEVTHYPILFADAPYYDGQRLYCNVVNVYTEPITVQYTSESGLQSQKFRIEPGASLTRIELDFIPDHICYNDEYCYALEVIHD